MQPAPGPLSEQQGESPLPPALTSTPPSGPVPEAETLAPPFVAGRPDHRPALGPDALPADTPASTEPPMPWEEAPGVPHSALAGDRDGTDAWAVLPDFPANEAAAPGPEGAPGGFPLDALILPAEAQRPPEAEADRGGLAEAVAERLEALAARLRGEGLDTLLRPGADADVIDRLLAALFAGYLAR
ncbi:MAG TPA: hypothetical protein VK939_10740 [Longimicrobiales bacterium]|nr:hypothetical protein [Longimicrobiales bacterium]